MRCALRILKPDVLTAHGSRSPTAPTALCTDTCAAFCTSGLARAIKDTVKCTIDLPVLGITTAAHTSDAGQQIQYGHGATRSKGRPPTPETAYLEQYDILVNNDVEHPRVNRDSVSCRRPHRESQNGFYTPPLDNAGNPKKRTGFMVPCQTSSDCYSRCGEHPTSGMAYVCTKNPLFYTFHVVNESLTEETLAVELSAQDLAPGLPVGTDYDSFEARLAVLEARPTWIPKADTVSTQSYFVDEPGENRFDVPTGSGVCTDVRMEFQHSGCESRVGSAAVVGLVGCTAKLGANLAYCGARVDRYGPDFLETSISSESLEYPRTLVEGTVVNGIPQGKVECSDAIDCMTKCERLGRISRDGGLDVPLACALCSSVCPTNLGTTIVDGIEALAVDVGNAVRLTEKCFTGGLAGCICNILLSLKPAWIDTLPSPQERCQGGNIFGLLATKILELTLKSVEEAINENAIRPVNFMIDSINNVIRSLFRAVSFGSNNGPKLPRVPEACLTGYFNPGGQCFSGDEDFYKHFSCYNTDRASADKQCYFFRCGFDPTALLQFPFTNPQTPLLAADSEPSAAWKGARIATAATKSCSPRRPERSSNWSTKVSQGARTPPSTRHSLPWPTPLRRASCAQTRKPRATSATRASTSRWTSTRSSSAASSTTLNRSARRPRRPSRSKRFCDRLTGSSHPWCGSGRPLLRPRPDCSRAVRWPDSPYSTPKALRWPNRR